MIKNFTCYNFKNITCSELEFARINLLIGPNNAGKSNFIRALSFAANMVNAHAEDTTCFLAEVKRNGWMSAVNKSSTDHIFRLKWKFELIHDQPVTYTLNAHVDQKKDNNYIDNETLDSAKKRNGYEKPYNYFRCHSFQKGCGEFSTAGMKSQQNNRLRADVDPQESVLLQMDNLFFENKELFSSPFVRDDIRDVLDSMRKYFRSFYSYACTSFNIAAIRELQDEQAEGKYLKKDGSNFVNVYIHAMEDDPNFEENYNFALRKLMHCKNVKINNVAGKVWMEIENNGYYFPLSDVSDGTIHLLILLLLLNLPKSNGISMLAIDEPEMNLHPAWQKLLADEILKCQSFKQCFISTHSPEFLDEFTNDFLNGKVNVFVFNPLSKTSIRQLNSEKLKKDLEDWTLGDLYRIGDPMIGGWPQ